MSKAKVIFIIFLRKCRIEFCKRNCKSTVMEDQKIVQVTAENIADEHVCCAITDKKCREGYEAKKAWLKRQFENGYVFKKLDVRGKVFIEYVPAENGWLPIDAPGHMLINCFWVSGRFKGQGNGKRLFQECLNDAQGMNGIVAVTAKKKQPFMSDRKFFQRQGFELCDTAKPYFELWHLPLKNGAPKPKFKPRAKEGICDVENGLSVYYTDGCPFNDFYVNSVLANTAKSKDIPLKISKLETRKQAQNHFVPHTLYSVFFNGKFVTQQVLSEKSFEKFIS